MKVMNNYNKRKYLIKNIFTNEQMTVNKGRIKRFHKPPLIDPVKTLQSETSRITDLKE